jgi:hypothetical protein
MTPDFPTATALTQFHDARLVGRSLPESPQTDPLWQAIARNHDCNRQLWDEEDQARRRDVPESAIAANKRAIDGFNQQRNDATESIDALFLAALAHVTRGPNCRLNSETLGAMHDRLSILSLKIFHMRIQSERAEASAQHRERCRGSLVILEEQRGDLARCFDELLDDARNGRAYFKIYRQFKMYNDPTLNPYLYAAVNDARP